jgi:hypothetical protein
MKANYDEVICPNCVTQFRAVPVNVQHELITLKAENAKLREALQKIADHNFDALKGSTKDYYVALKEGMSVALAARAALENKHD